MFHVNFANWEASSTRGLGMFLGGTQLCLLSPLTQGMMLRKDHSQAQWLQLFLATIPKPGAMAGCVPHAVDRLMPLGETLSPAPPRA